jgi:hypothetical protein
VRGIKGELHSSSNAHEISDGVAKSELLQVVAGEVSIGGGFAPEAVYGRRVSYSCSIGSIEEIGKRTLNHNHSTLNFLRKFPRQGRVGEVSSIRARGRLAGREEDNGRSWATPMLRIPPDALSERVAVGRIMVEQLREDEIAC